MLISPVKIGPTATQPTELVENWDTQIYIYHRNGVISNWVVIACSSVATYRSMASGIVAPMAPQEATHSLLGAKKVFGALIAWAFYSWDRLPNDGSFRQTKSW
jgi:hypothetical protein